MSRPGPGRSHGPDLLPDEKAHEVETILGPDNRIDIAHICAAYLNDCEYFVTEDKTDFIDGGRREALESLLGVKVLLTRESWTTSPGRGIWTRMTSPLRLSPIND